MKITGILCMLFIALPVLAGTWKDDFEDGNLTGWMVAPDSEKVETVDGYLVVTDVVYNPELLSALYFNDGQKVEDYVLAFDTRMVRQMDPWHCIWIAIRCSAPEWPPPEGIGCMGFEPAARGLTSIMFDQAGNEHGRQSHPCIIEMGEWYHVDVSVDGTNVSVSVDGNPICQVDWVDQAHFPKAGMVGIGAGGAEVHFDNFVITGDEIQDNFAITPECNLLTVWGEVKQNK